ncbi:MAG TPA: DNA recombination protein RmuC [Rhodospirillaceae bacterium]|nr:DNA recombination protein RmuC [Rhodospirillaceae bacterium]HAA92682.1 DNA recombination protein RmuC [Rhodospirillaceae bacterium]HAT34083.1 DNA recombination protein RmuC [Rhodospirillaceae bacterium]
MNPTLESLLNNPTFLVALGALLLALVATGVLIAGRRRDQSSELAAKISLLAEQQAIAQSQLSERLQAQERALTKSLDERLEAVSRRVGDSLVKQASENANTMTDLRERLAVIGKAQENITQLSTDVVNLQQVLSNKQTRGAFGETQLADQVKNILPPSAFGFQEQLPNGSRVDCLLKLPNPPGPIAVDAKFPLESFNRFRAAEDDAEREVARKQFGADVLKHVKDISSKYIIPGETADSALMFLPAEAVYAELHASLPEVVEKSHRARVYIVSPTTLMATLNTIRAVLKDAEMREQAGLIQKEVLAMNDDVGRLDDRVSKLQRHFGQAEDDIRQIRISTEKVQKRAVRIAEVELEDQDTPPVPDLREEAAE